MKLEVNITCGWKGFTLKTGWESQESRIGILGASGCGKSMTLKAIAGIIKPDKGRIVLGDRVLFDSGKKINIPPQKRKVGYLFQNYALFPNMTVGENIRQGLNGLSAAEKKARTEAMLRRFEIKELEGRYPHEISGGQQQRAALARIMAYEPELLLLDEPFSALDSFLKDNMKQQMQELLAQYRGSMIMVSHSRDEIYAFCDRLLIMDRGRVLESGPTRQVFEKPSTKEAARLTGCKNISPVRKLGEYEVLALDWGLALHTAQPVTEEVGYIGFRAHDVAPSLPGEANSFAVHVTGSSQEPFEEVLLLKADKTPGRKTAACGEKQIPEVAPPIWWKRPRIPGESQAAPVPEWVSIAPERIFLLRGNETQPELQRQIENSKAEVRK